MLFIQYPRCSTCRKAQKWLEDEGVHFDQRDIVLDKPTKAELEAWYKASGLPLKRFFNTSGIQYRELGLKDRLPHMSEEEQLQLLASDGKLVKRPLLIGDGFVLTGFKEGEWRAALGL